MAGWSLGAKKSQRKKNHANYRGSKRKKILAVRRKLTKPTGFMYLEANATHNAITGMLVVRISGRRLPDNMGPGLNVVETLPWSRSKNEDGSAPKALNRLLDDVERKVTARELPETGMFLKGCCNAGQSPDEVLELTCSRCSCWYCELSS